MTMKDTPPGTIEEVSAVAEELLARLDGEQEGTARYRLSDKECHGRKMLIIGDNLVKCLHCNVKMRLQKTD